MNAARLHPVMLRSLWSYRGFIGGAVARDLQQRYHGSVLGALWMVLNPLAQILVFTLVFAEIMRPRLPGHDQSAFAYSIYLCSGVVAWSLFSEVLVRLNTVFIDNANLIKKTNFPRAALPVVVVLSALTNFAIIFAILIGFLAVTGNFPGVVVFALAPVTVLTIVLATALGLLLGTLNVFFRDVGQLTGVALGFWFWLTPIVYLKSTLPPRAQVIVSWNPMTPIVNAFQAVLLDRTAPDWTALAGLAVVAGALLLLSGAFFVRHASELVDEL